jgi:hypothetical protein
MAGGEVEKLPIAHAAKRCGAKTRSDHPCKNFPLKGKRRCKLHGGMSTGPKTAEGIERIRQASLKHGRYTKVAIPRRRVNRELLRQMRELIDAVELTFP